MRYLGSLFLLSSSLLLASSLSKEATSSSLIVYNDGVALVHEQRVLKLDKDDKEILYSPVANTIIADSISISLPKEVTLYSGHYRYDQLNIYKLLDAHIGSKVKLQRDEYTLLSYQNNMVLLQDKKGQIVSAESKDLIFSSIPSKLLTKPSLVYSIETRKSIESKMEIDYLIRNLSWSSNYILNIKDNKADLLGWISIDNRSGKSYNNTELHVLAGDVNIQQTPKKTYTYTRDMVLSQAPSHQEHEGYHFYTLPFKVSILNQETTQLKFLSKQDVNIKRLYKAYASNPLVLNSNIKHNVLQLIELEKLDTPLPKGVVRAYSPLNSKKIFIGESHIAHTPKDTTIQIEVGNSFDLVLKESVVVRSDAKEYYDATVRYTLKNSSDEKKSVEILVPFSKNDSNRVKTKEKFSYKDGVFVLFEINIDANEKKSFSVNYISKKI